MDKFTLQEFDWLQGQQMVHEKCVGISQASHNALMSIISGLRCIVLCVGAQQFYHNLCSNLTNTRKKGEICPMKGTYISIIQHW